MSDGERLDFLFREEMDELLAVAQEIWKLSHDQMASIAIATGADASEVIAISFIKADAGAQPTSAVTSSGIAVVSLTMTVAQVSQSIIFAGNTSGKIGTSNTFDVELLPSVFTISNLTIKIRNCG